MRIANATIIAGNTILSHGNLRAAMFSVVAECSITLEVIRVPDKYSDAGKDQWSYVTSGNNNGLRYLFIMSNLKYKPYMQKDLKTVSFMIKHNGDRQKVRVTPQDRLYFSLVKN